ncbi:MAG: 50S ribosomal protein L25 [Anaerolineae bacterium]
MEEGIELRSCSRTVQGKQVKQLRARGWVPAVLFGADMPPRPIQVEERALMKVLQQAGATSLIHLFVDDEPQPHFVLAHEVQRDIVSSRVRHVDFFQVRMDRTVRTEVPLEIVGESPLVKTGRAVLVQVLTHLEIDCLPSRLVHSIPVDVSGLDSLDRDIVVGDLSVPPGVTIHADPHDVVVSLVPPRVAVEEEEAAPAQEKESS